MICFLDTETTSLRPDRRAWEIGVIVRADDGDTEWSTFIDCQDLDLGNADPTALKIGKFYERHPSLVIGLRGQVMSEIGMLIEVEELTRGATIVGAVPSFDAEVLATRMRANGICPSWIHRLVDVESFTAGALQMAVPLSLGKMCAAFGVTYVEADQHSALGDARMVRDLYDAVLGV